MSKHTRSGKAVFFDRDGTLNVDPGYISDPANLELYPGVGNELKRLKEAGYTLIVLTNQSGVARGLVRPEALEKIHQRMNELLGESGVRIDEFLVCMHHPAAGCDCRKPGTALIRLAEEKYGLDLTESIIVGDRETDLQAGVTAGLGKVILVRTGHGGKTETHLRECALDRAVHFVADDLSEVVDWILDRARG